MIEQGSPSFAAASGPILVPEAMVLAPPLGTFVLFRDLPAALPERARALVAGREHGIRTLVWESGGVRSGLGWFETVAPTLGFTILGPGPDLTEVTMARGISGEPAEIAAFLGRTGAPAEATAAFLIGRESIDGAAARVLHVLLDALAVPGGVMELAGEPETGGTFLQGWITAPFEGPCQIVTATGVHAAAAAGFRRDDLLAPAAGLCLYALGMPVPHELPEAVLVRSRAGIQRLSLLPDAAQLRDRAAATQHVRAMLRRIDGGGEVTAPFLRICRPKYPGQDTLSGHPGPVAAAFDCVLAAPSGDLFLSGWLLDPLHQVDRVVVRNTAGFHARIDGPWHRIQRPDLNTGFGGDARFSGLLDPRETLHGFLCHVPGGSNSVDGAETYLELVLSGGECLFLPVSPARCRDAAVWPSVLARVPQHDPALEEILQAHVAPFLVCLPPAPARGGVRLHRLGGGAAGKTVTALMPLRDPRRIEPALAMLADTPDAAEIDLLLAADDSAVPNLVARLDDQFRFYGLTGGVALVRPHLTAGQRTDLLLAETATRHVLLWRPEALPKQPGWLAALRAVADATPGCALVSPLLTCADGSLHFGGPRLAGRAEAAVCGAAGFDRRDQSRLRAAVVSAGAAELALIDRARLTAAGGVAPRLLGDRFAHHDLGARLRAAGGSVWFTPAAAFWMLDAPEAAADPAQGMLDRLDAALIAVSGDGNGLEDGRVPA